MFNKRETKDVFDQLVEENFDDTELKDESCSTTSPKGSTPESGGDVDDSAAEPGNPDVGGDVSDGPQAAVGTGTSRGLRILRWAIAGAVIAVFVAATGLAGYFGWQVKQQGDVTTASREALTAAESYAAALTSLDNQKIDQDFARVLDGAAGQFKDMYSQSAAQLRQLLIDNKAVSHGTVVDAAIKSASKDKVQVLIFVDQSISNSVNPQPRIDRSRIAMTMERIDGRWLASSVDVK